MSVDSHTTILSNVAAYFASKLAAYGATPQGVDWNSQASHELRDRQFLRLLDGSPDASILDLGCGFGDFFRFLRAHGHRGAFIGYDVAPNMIAEAMRLHGEGPDCRWCVGAEPEETADFAIASGVFNVKGNVPGEIWTCYVQGTIDILAQAGRRGFSFNMLSLSSDAERRRSETSLSKILVLPRLAVRRAGKFKWTFGYLAHRVTASAACCLHRLLAAGNFSPRNRSDIVNRAVAQSASTAQSGRRADED